MQAFASSWLAEMRAEHDKTLAKIHADGVETRREMAALIQGAETRLVDRIHGVELRLDRRIGDVQSNLMKWSFVFWCDAVAAIAALAGILRP